MSVREAYNIWAATYDEMLNKTRDLEAVVIRKTIVDSYDSILELGCGTGKNTEHLLEKCQSLIALDFSEEMLAKAIKRINSEKISFRQQNLIEDWDLPHDSVDLTTCSLVLEHIEDLNPIFNNASKVLRQHGKFYFSELHPFKQYSGSKARFDTDNGIHELETYVHHITDYTKAAFNNGFILMKLNEWFDEGDRNSIPRLVSFVFQKK